MSIDVEAPPTTDGILHTLAEARREIDSWEAHLRAQGRPGEPGHVIAAERAARGALATLQAAACDTKVLARDAFLDAV